MPIVNEQCDAARLMERPLIVYQSVFCWDFGKNLYDIVSEFLETYVAAAA